MKKVGALDCDDVLADLHNYLLKYVNETFGWNVKREDHTLYDLEKIWKCTKEESVKIIDDFYNHEYFNQIKPVEGAQEAVKMLSEDYELVVITSRPVEIEKHTNDWFERYFSNRIKKVICTGHYTRSSNKISKAEICIEEKASFILEDNLDVVRECALNGIKPFLFDQPWNRNGMTSTEEKRSGIVRIYHPHWRNVHEYLTSE